MRLRVFIPLVFRLHVASEAVDAVGPEGRHNPSRCREAPEISSEYQTSPSGAHAEVYRPYMCCPPGLRRLCDL